MISTDAGFGLMKKSQELGEVGRLVDPVLDHLGMSWNQLALQVGAKRSTLSGIKTGKTGGGINLLQNIAEALGLSINDLLMATQVDKSRREIMAGGVPRTGGKQDPPPSRPSTPQQPDQDFVGPTGEMTADGLAELRRLLGGMAQHETQSLTQPPSWAQKLQADVDELKALIARLARHQGKGPPEGPQPA